MVSEIFSGICNSDHYLYPGAEAALHCGCSSGVASGRVFLEIYQKGQRHKWVVHIFAKKEVTWT